MTQTVQLDAENPFANPSSLPFQLPPFGEVREEHFLPAFEAGMAQQLAEVQAITANPEPATFANTVEALERSGQLLERTAAVFFTLSSGDATPGIDKIEAEIGPRLTAHEDSITLNRALFARIQSVYDTREQAGLTDEQTFLVEKLHRNSSLAGAGLDDASSARLRELNGRLSELEVQFDQKLQADSNALALVVDSAEELAGLDESAISAASAAAEARGLTGKYLISLVLFTGHPLLSTLTNRETRRKLFEASSARGSRGGDHDTRATALEMVRVRAERARLLGFENHAEAAAAKSTAGSASAIRARLEQLSTPAAANARREQDVLQATIDAEQAAAGEPSFALEPWDWAFYTEKVRARDYAVDTSQMRPFFEAKAVLENGVFYAANRLFGVTFTERPELRGHHADAVVYEVGNEDGTEVGLFSLDLYTRDSKRGGAWMNSVIQQNRLLGEPTVVLNTLNVPKPAEGSPTLLTFDEVETLFHEFGHALHGLFALVGYPSLGGTNVPRDFVEFPSQVNEMWMLWPEVLRNYAKHHETGEQLSEELVERLLDSASFNEGFGTSEYLAASVIDLEWHSLSPEEAAGVTDVEAFEQAVLRRYGLDLPAVPPRYTLPYFQHIFAGGYSAGYYGYIWSEVLDAATVDWFAEQAELDGGLRAAGERFRRSILEPGGSREAMSLVSDLLGGPAPIEPLLKRRGLQ
ncbi:peptidase M3 [Pseudoclavibacter sp. RFBI5]|uniref:M3 family metallopeptidase n=1 Tax=Pseudoclavibacter sp. RFBI5 TaxID=2080578 RepID=UPI000CE891C5|nr:M3 family metallopeptidase [Pseudoclavibacter sp. RFBI5]PPG03928.1 peptidase M3 [Pseudoclavibacter sp. RFBI5]